MNNFIETPKYKSCPKCYRWMIRHNLEYTCLCGYGEIIPERKVYPCRECGKGDLGVPNCICPICGGE